MVCSRCKMVVKAEIEKQQLQPLKVELGEVEFLEPTSIQQVTQLEKELSKLGFVVIDDHKSQTIEKIKNIIIILVHHREEPINNNLSSLITAQLPHDYSYLSNLFSEVTGTTIEKYFICQRVEKVKELIVYGELSLSEIAYKLGYSSVAYLSNQFKKVTGFTPTHFKTLKEIKRKNIDDI